jgi:NitT/TauT family transport system permease protein
MTDTAAELAETRLLVGPPEGHAAGRRRLVGGLAAVALLLTVWQVASISRFVASPAQALGTLVDGFASGWIYQSLGETATVVAITFVVSYVGGTAIGIVLGTNRYLADVCEPIIMSIYAVPKIVLFPVLLLVFGLGLNSLLALGIMSAVFPAIVNALAAVRAMNPMYFKVARALGASWHHHVLKVFVPAMSLPLAVSLRLTLSVSILAVAIGEMVATGRGVGYELFRAYLQLDVPKLYALFLLLVLVAGASNLLLMGLERRVRYE